MNGLKNDKLDHILGEIEKLLANDHHYTQCNYIAKLRDLHESPIERDQHGFKNLVTTGKYLWLGMGTIADMVLSSKSDDDRFKQAYYELAIECQAQGLASIYSEKNYPCVRKMAKFDWTLIESLVEN